MSDGENRTVLALCGDAAFQTHFWPGRGMNSVIKEASMLACSVVRSALRLRQQNQGYRLSANTREFNTYTQFVNGLREREHKGRSVVRVEIFFVIFFPPLSTRSDVGTAVSSTIQMATVTHKTVAHTHLVAGDSAHLRGMSTAAFNKYWTVVSIISSTNHSRVSRSIRPKRRTLGIDLGFMT